MSCQIRRASPHHPISISSWTHWVHTTKNATGAFGLGCTLHRLLFCFYFASGLLGNACRTTRTSMPSIANNTQPYPPPISFPPFLLHPISNFLHQTHVQNNGEAIPFGTVPFSLELMLRARLLVSIFTPHKPTLPYVTIALSYVSNFFSLLCIFLIFFCG